MKGRPRRHKKATAVTRRTRFTEVGGQSLTNLNQEGQPLARSAFAANRQFSGTPVDIVEDHGDDFPGPQAKPSQQAQHGIIPLADHRRLVATPEQGFDLVDFQCLGEDGHLPVGDRWDRGSEIGGRPTLHVQKRKKARRPVMVNLAELGGCDCAIR